MDRFIVDFLAPFALMNDAAANILKSQTEVSIQTVRGRAGAVFEMVDRLEAHDFIFNIFRLYLNLCFFQPFRINWFHQVV